MPLSHEKKGCTYADYLKFPSDERWEIIDGIAYMQSTPTWQHQAASIQLASQFNNYLKGKPCRVFAAPFDLCIPDLEESDEDITNIISQPDIVVICDETKLRKTGYFGVPSLIIEISSPSTARNDKLFKFNKFEKAGVKEYWIVEPDTKLVIVFILQNNNRYGRPEIFTEIDNIEVSIFPDLVIELGPVFDF